MSDIHLILHKVRGEPAFDIAEPAFVAGEAAWIVATSGHRAYPVAHWPLLEVIARGITKTYEHVGALPEWTDLPDHYSAVPTRPRRTVREVLGTPKTEADYADILSQMSDEDFQTAVRAVNRSTR